MARFSVLTSSKNPLLVLLDLVSELGQQIGGSFALVDGKRRRDRMVQGRTSFPSFCGFPGSLARGLGALHAQIQVSLTHTFLDMLIIKKRCQAFFPES